MKNKYEILNPLTSYHIYNRANGSEKLFLSSENYRYFLQKYQEYISPIADTFCYCLMPNHFHFLIRVKPEADLIAFFSARQNLQGFKNLEGLTPAALPKLLSNQFSNFLNGYSKAFNKMYKRKGSLFMHTFKRKKIDDILYLKQLTQYIHNNPIEAKLCSLPDEWPYSSYQVLTSQEISFLNKQEAIFWFEDEHNFKLVHSSPRDFRNVNTLES